MAYIHIVAALAVLQYLLFSMSVGRARVRYRVRAPAVTGDEGFERVYRVQMNTLEQLVAFLPVLLLAGVYWPGTWVAAIGLVWIIGRFVYRRAYLGNPAKRGPGFMLTILPTAILLVMTLWGALRGVVPAA